MTESALPVHYAQKRKFDQHCSRLYSGNVTAKKKIDTKTKLFCL